MVEMVISTNAYDIYHNMYQDSALIILCSTYRIKPEEFYIFSCKKDEKVEAQGRDLLHS